MSRQLTALFAIALTTVPTTVFALTISDTLEPGDQFRIAFVTSEDFQTTALSTDISNYNLLATNAAQSQADLATLDTDWFAIVSVPESSAGAGDGISAKTNTGTDDSPAGDNGVPIFRVDGVKIADHYDDLWDRTIDAPLNVAQDGSILGVQGTPITAWTGTTADGEINTAQPLGSSFFAGRGQIGASGDLWMGTFGGNAGNLAPIYTISGVLTVPNSAIPGDYDDDGDRDGVDFLLWQRTDGTAAGLMEWQSRYGSGGNSLRAMTSVPEPSVLALLFFGGLILCVARRRIEAMGEKALANRNALNINRMHSSLVVKSE